MKQEIDRKRLSLHFAAVAPGLLGEMTYGELLWDQGGTITLERLRTVKDLHLLVLCLEGQSDYIDETGKCAVIGPGDLMLIPRGLAHSYRPTPGRGWSEIYVWMRGALPDIWWSSGFLQRSLSLFHVDPVTDWAGRLCRLCEGQLGGVVGVSNDERLSQLQAWLATMKENAQRSDLEEVPWFRAACVALEEGDLRTPSFDELARLSGVSYESFRKKFTAQSGMSPGKYRLAAMVQKACRLLSCSKCRHKEIAEKLGFSDEFHFARTFRRYIGLPPSQYRRSQCRVYGGK